VKLQQELAIAIAGAGTFVLTTYALDWLGFGALANLTSRRFSPPWRVDKLACGYVVRDANGQGSSGFTRGTANPRRYSQRSAPDRRQRRTAAGAARKGGLRTPTQWAWNFSTAPACTLFGHVTFQQHSANRHRGIQWWLTRHYGFGAAPGGFHALANSLAFADFCGAVRRNARGIGAIADFLSLVFARR